MRDVPHPGTRSPEVQDWRPLLDRALSGLPEKYRAAVVLCELEGRSRREAARQLGVPEGTLSSRLAAARKLLAKRLAGTGLALLGGTASAQVPGALVWSATRAAARVAAGQVTAAPAPAVVLMQGVLKTMFLKRLKLTVGVLLVLGALGVGGVAYHAAAPPGTARAAAPDRPANELEALRKENELLRLNLLVVLEKVRAQEEELRGLRGRQAEAGPGAMGMGGAMRGMGAGPGMGPVGAFVSGPGVAGMGMGPMGGATQGAGPMTGPGGGSMGSVGAAPRDPVQEAESAVKALREARDEETKQQATRALERALRLLKEGEKPKGALGGPAKQ